MELHKVAQTDRKHCKWHQNFNKMSGGAFRNELQKRVDSSNPEATSGRGGQVSKVGGFDDIVKGIRDDLEAQLKQYEDQLSVEKDPAIRRDLEMFIKSVKDVGINKASKLQAMAATGVARQEFVLPIVEQVLNSLCVCNLHLFLSDAVAASSPSKLLWPAFVQTIVEI